MNINETALMQSNDARLIIFEWNQIRSLYFVGRFRRARVRLNGTEIRIRLIAVNRQLARGFQTSYLTCERGISVTIIAARRGRYENVLWCRSNHQIVSRSESTAGARVRTLERRRPTVRCQQCGAGGHKFSLQPRNDL